jgi:hypothetical protein
VRDAAAAAGHRAAAQAQAAEAALAARQAAGEDGAAEAKALADLQVCRGGGGGCAACSPLFVRRKREGVSSCICARGGVCAAGRRAAARRLTAGGLFAQAQAQALGEEAQRAADAYDAAVEDANRERREADAARAQASNFTSTLH